MHTITVTSGAQITVDSTGFCFVNGSTEALLPGTLLLRKIVTRSEMIDIVRIHNPAYHTAK